MSGQSVSAGLEHAIRKGEVSTILINQALGELFDIAAFLKQLTGVSAISAGAISELNVVELKRWISIIVDASVDQGNGESIVPTEDLNDARDAVFGMRGDIDE